MTGGKYNLNIVTSLEGESFTPAERNEIIKFAVSIGTRAEMSTTSLLRPLKMKDLKSAFAESKQRLLAENEMLKLRMARYDSKEVVLDKTLVEYFDGIPTKEQFVAYHKRLIKQNLESIDTMFDTYFIYVNTHLTGKLSEIHRSLNPRVTFGYSTMLHEICDFPLDEYAKNLLLNSNLKGTPRISDEHIHDFGYIMLSDGENNFLLYEDLCVFVNDRCILQCVSHEQACNINFTDEELASFEVCADKALRGGIIAKLKRVSQ
ncbi:MAG: hypothetical protein NC350_02895 [Corallococcus sp.]|nr:hypothetical protein [Corallococcus sp.]